MTGSQWEIRGRRVHEVRHFVAVNVQLHLTQYLQTYMNTNTLSHSQTWNFLMPKPSLTELPARGAAPATAGAQDNAFTCMRVGVSVCVWAQGSVCTCVAMDGHKRACVGMSRHTLILSVSGLDSSLAVGTQPPRQSWRGSGTPGGSPMEVLLSAFTPVSSRPPRCCPAPVLLTGKLRHGGID